MFHTVDSCPLTKLDGGLSRLHSAEDDAVHWLANLKKKKTVKTIYRQRDKAVCMRLTQFS